MRRISKLNVEPGAVYDACTGTITDAALRGKLTVARNDMVAHFAQYDVRAASNELFSFQASDWGKDGQQVLAGLTKKELTNLYTQEMVGSDGPGRRYYDQIMMLAPLGKCPFCGFGQVSTLDHFLSKARYPAFSIHCSNLIPCCADCNKGKGSSVVEEVSQTMHPYFEAAIIDGVPWLFAKVIEAIPVTVQYFVKTPDEWSVGLRQRLTNHFDGLELGRRFAIEAAAELAGLAGMLVELPSAESIAGDDVSHVLALDEHVGLADGV
jgi:hypothetical protein